MRDSRDLRIAAIFIVAFTSFLGTLVAPAVIRVAEWATSRRTSNGTSADEDDTESLEAVTRSRASASDLVQRALRVLGAFSTGIVLGTSTLHLLPEAIIFMDEATNDGPGSHPSVANAAAVCANGSVATSPAEVLEDITVPFPWAELIMVLTVFAMFIFEKELFALVERRTVAAAKKKAKEDAEAQAAEEAAAGAHTVIDAMPNSEPICVEDAPASKEPTTAADEPGTDEASAKERAMAIVYSHVVELALSVHSVILGLTVGLLTEYATVRVLVIAVSIDQFSDGVAVGSTLCQSKALSFRHAAGLRAFFAWTCSIGIAIGVGIEQEGGSGDPMAQGILASMSAGLLLLLAMGEMLPGIVRPFSHRGGHCHGPASPEPSPAVGPADVAASRETSAVAIGDAASTAHAEAEEEPSDSVSTPWRWVLYLCMCVGFAGMAIIAVYGG